MLIKRVLIVWEHGGNLGHMSRLLPIAIALRKEDCEVFFAVADVPMARRYFGNLNFNFVVLPSVPLGIVREPGALNHADILLKLGFGDTTKAQLCVNQWVGLFHSIKPASVLVDSSPLAFYAARCAGLPALMIGHGFELPPIAGERPCFTPWVENAAQKVIQLEERLQQGFHALAQSLSPNLRLSAPTSVDDLFRPDQLALLAWPEFDHFDRKLCAERAVSGYRGPIWAEAPGAKQYDWPDRDGPKVLCYLNLRDKRYDLVWQALKQNGANVLEISPNGVAKASEAARGWGIQVVEEPILLGALISTCDAVVGHGGMGLTSMALHAGKPILLLPEHLEQTILAYRLSKQGLAIATIKLRDKVLLQKKIGELLTGFHLKQSATSFANHYHHYQSALAVNVVVCKIKELAEQ